MPVLIWPLPFVLTLNSVPRMACTGQKKGKKSIHIYVSFMSLLQKSVWKPLLLWRKSLNFCVFQLSESKFFWGLILLCCIFYRSHIESSLVGIQFKSNPGLIQNEQASWWTPTRFAVLKSQTYSHDKYAITQRTGIVGLQMGKRVSLCFSEALWEENITSVGE